MEHIFVDLIPGPVSAYCDRWGKDIKTLNQWCQKGWIPGAYKHPCGEWWVRPIDLLGLDISGLSLSDGKTSGDSRPNQRPVLRPVDGGRSARIR